MSLKKIIINDQKDHNCICCDETINATDDKMIMFLFNKQTKFICSECSNVVFNYNNWIGNDSETGCKECFLCEMELAYEKDNIGYMPDTVHSMEIDRWYNFYSDTCRYDGRTVKLVQ